MSPTRQLTLWSASLAALLLTTSAHAEEPAQLLTRMVDAAREQSYQGAFVYERTSSFSTHQVWRQRDGDQTTERVLQTDGQPQEWLKRNGNLICTTSVVLPSVWNQPPLLSDQLAALPEWYSLQMLGSTRVADRAVFVLAIKPRDAYRYAYEMYLDQETGLLLKSLLINERSVLLERFQFTSLQLGPVAAAALRPSSLCLPQKARMDARADAARDWVPGWLPPGFTLGHSEVRALDAAGAEVITQVFTDGLARLTLFVERLGADSLANDLSAKLGPTVAVSRKLVRADGDYLATVVGEVPPAAAERVADSLAPDFDFNKP